MHCLEHIRVAVRLPLVVAMALLALIAGTTVNQLATAA